MKDDLKKIVDDSGLDPKLRRVLSESLTALAAWQETLEKELRATIAMELSSGKECAAFPARVKTALVDNRRLNELSAWRFFDASPYAQDLPMPPDPASGIFFLNVPYAELNTYLHRKFKGAGGIEYELVPFYGYVENERKLALLWRLYGFVTPRPFSPWARRAVRVCFSQPFQGKPDLDMEANGLETVLLKDKALVWNVEIRTREQAAMPSVMSRGGGETYKYRYSARDEEHNLALWPLPQDVDEGGLTPEELDVSLTDEHVILSCNTPFSLACEKIAFCTPGERNDLITFENTCEVRQFREPATTGEFNRLLAAFSTQDFGASLSGAAGEIVRRYELGHRTGFCLEQFPRRSEPVDVFFSCKNSEKKIFLGDYANWILAELERRFPAFCWRGRF